MRRIICSAVAAIALLLAPFTASAQDWPTRAITMVVPYAAGGPIDTLARILAARLSEILGQQVVIENMPGAGGMTGSSRVAKAAADGYTVLLSGSAVLPRIELQRVGFDKSLGPLVSHAYERQPASGLEDDVSQFCREEHPAKAPAAVLRVALEQRPEVRHEFGDRVLETD